MHKISDYNTDGLTPPLNFTKTPTAGGSSFSRVFNPTSVALSYKNGALVDANPNEPFVNIWTGKKEK
jgi:hypothetical protein